MSLRVLSLEAAQNCVSIPNEGVVWVAKGELAGTFEYPTPGAEGLRQAIKLMNGEKIEKKIVLGTKTITKANAPEILKVNNITI